jgi:hypothetical protein
MMFTTTISISSMYSTRSVVMVPSIWLYIMAVVLFSLPMLFIVFKLLVHHVSLITLHVYCTYVFSTYERSACPVGFRYLYIMQTDYTQVKRHVMQCDNFDNNHCRRQNFSVPLPWNNQIYTQTYIFTCMILCSVYKHLRVSFGTMVAGWERHRKIESINKPQYRASIKFYIKSVIIFDW